MLKPSNSIDMDAQASEAMVAGIVRRLERDGHYLTPSAVGRIHGIIAECCPDRRAEGTQRELSALVRERVEREP